LMFLFLALFEQRTQVGYRILLWVPLFFCVLAFSLLVVHFGSVVYFESWKERTRKYYFAFYCSLNAIFFAGHLILVVLAFERPLLLEKLVQAQLGLAAVVYVMLGCVIAFQGWQLWRMTTAEPTTITRLGRRSTRAKMAWFVGFVVFVFLTRALLNLLVLGSVMAWDEIEAAQGFTTRGSVWALSFLVWEVIPLIVFILHFWPQNTRRSESSEPPIVVSREISSLSHVVGNNSPIPIRSDETLEYHPLPRYDSDEDEKLDSTNSMYSPYSTTPKALFSSGSATLVSAVLKKTGSGTPY